MHKAHQDDTRAEQVAPIRLENPSWSYTAPEATRLLVGLVGVELALVAVYLFTQLVVPSWGVLASLFDVGLDQSLPSWFSAVQLAALGGAFVLAVRANRPQSGLPSRPLIALAFVGFFLSADEGAGIHERVTTAMSKADLTWLLFRGGHGGWVALYAIVALVVVVLAGRWLQLLWAACPREAIIGLIGIAVYLVGVVGVEVLGYETESGTTNTLDNLRIASEELMEMAGASIMLYAALLIALRVGSDDRSTASAALADETQE